MHTVYTVYTAKGALEKLSCSVHFFEGCPEISTGDLQHTRRDNPLEFSFFSSKVWPIYPIRVGILFGHNLKQNKMTLAECLHECIANHVFNYQDKIR